VSEPAGDEGNHVTDPAGNEVDRVSDPAANGALSISEFTVARGGRPVVREVSLEVVPGEVTALLGPNGAGKSTLVLAAGGVLKPASRSSPRAGACSDS